MFCWMEPMGSGIDCGWEFYSRLRRDGRRKGAQLGDPWEKGQ